MSDRRWHILILPLLFAVAILAYGTQWQRTLGQLFGSGDYNGWDIAIAVLSDPFTMCYLVVPLFTLSTYRFLTVGFAPHALVRHGSMMTAVAAGSVSAARTALQYLGVWLGVAVALGTSAGWEAGWSPAALGGATELPTSNLVQSGPPALALTLQLLFLLGAILAWGAVLSAVAAIGADQRWLRVVCVALVVATVASFHGTWIPAPLRLINYLAAYHAVLDLGNLWLPLVVDVAVVGALLLALRGLDRVHGPHVA